MTAIYFLLAQGEFSAFHRLRSEELWVHLAGDPLELLILGRDVRRIILGHAAPGAVPVAVVPEGEMQAARSSGDYTLSACIVAPGFEFEDFTLASREDLLRQHPDQRDLILAFTR